MVRTAWFDETRGFCPVRTESRFRGEIDLPPLSTSDLTLIQKDAVWVPETLSIRFTPRPGDEYYVTYSFDWRSVNQGIADETFSIEALKDPGEKVYVTDNRLDKPILVADLFAVAPEDDFVPSRWSVRKAVVAGFATFVLLGGIALIRFFIRSDKPQASSRE